MGRLIEVVKYNPEWITAFNDEAAKLTEVFGKRLLEIHHIGSTAVPGLDAKPIIDIAVVLDSTDDINAFNHQMEALGYRVRGECLDAPIPGTPGRFYFSKETNGIRSHHVHVYANGHHDVADKIAFRNFLRANGNVAAAYAHLKRQAAARHSFDNVGYMRAKDGFTKATLAEARSRFGVRSQS